MKYYFFVLVSFFSFNPSFAAVYCEGKGLNNIVLDFVLNFNSNLVGAEASGSYKSPSGSYTGYCTNTTPYQVNNGYMIRTTTTLPPSSIHPGFFVVNDFIDAQFKTREPPLVVPYPQTNPPSASGVNVPANIVDHPVTGMNAGSDGSIVFKLRKDVIGGLVSILPNIKLFDVYREYVKGEYAPSPVVSLFTNSQIIAFPSLCTINSSNDLVVDFGDVDSSLVGGNNSLYQKSSNINFACTGTIFEKPDPLLLRVVSSPSSFSLDATVTSNASLGVVTKSSGSIIPPNGAVKVAHNKGKGSVDLHFSLVKKMGEKVKTGAFTSTLTLLMELP